MRLIFRPEAEEELLEAIDWYDAKGQGLGAEFLRCVDACAQRILRQPESYPVVHRKTRMSVVRRFPYLLLYRLRDEEISIVAVFHAKRSPKLWKGR